MRFRAAWVATVKNIDWPSKPGLTTEQQKREILKIVQTAQSLHLNAIILQVRTSCDALYNSKIEPWSEYLTGKQGKAPEPFYDPLQFWIEQCHQRGIQLHAWINPFRAKVGISREDCAVNHISRTRPDLVKEYGHYLWLDPGWPESRDYTFSVVMDIVNRYDIDGIHIDDYFYPYPEARMSRARRLTRSRSRMTIPTTCTGPWAEGCPARIGVATTSTE